MLSPLKLGVFEIDPALAVGMYLGYFAEQGIELSPSRVISSDAQFADLASGRYHVIQTAFDNVANYALNDSNALGYRLDVSAFVPIDQGMGLLLIGAPHVGTTADLRNLTVSVDSPTSGFAYIVYALLRQAGLKENTDCSIVRHGGALQRLERLLAGEADATLLTSELADRAVEQGCHVLGTIATVLDSYLGSVLAATSKTSTPTLKSVAAAYTRARSFEQDPANRDQCISAVMAVQGVDIDTAKRHFDAHINRAGLVLTSRFDNTAMRNTLTLRQRFSGFDSSIDLDILSSAESPLVSYY